MPLQATQKVAAVKWSALTPRKAQPAPSSRICRMRFGSTDSSPSLAPLGVQHGDPGAMEMLTRGKPGLPALTAAKRLNGLDATLAVSFAPPRALLV